MTSTVATCPAFLTQSIPLQGWGRAQKQPGQKWQHTPFPSSQEEAYRYFPFHRFLQYSKKLQVSGLSIEKPMIPQEYECCLVFVGGVFSPTLSRLHMLPKQVVVLPLASALQGSYGAFIARHLERLWKEETDYFALTSGALQGGGVFVYIPPYIEVPCPIHVVYIGDDLAKVEAPCMHVFVGSHSHLHVVEVRSTQRGICAGLMDIVVEAKGRVHYEVLAQEAAEAMSVWSTRVEVKAEGKFISSLISKGNACMRQGYRFSLQGEASEVELSTLCAVQGKNHAHIHVQMDHKAPHSRSYQLCKNLLQDASRASFSGTIAVEGQKTSAYQLCKSLLLSDHCLVYTRPNLEIGADDVKASHGATISQMDPQELLYLRTRGVPIEQAQALLLQGFCQEIMAKITHKPLQEQAKNALAEIYA